MARPVWKGSISFGLVSVPVELYAAEGRNDISFHLVDSRNSARVRYERVNEETGEEVPWDKIVKGYEYSDGSYVLLSNEELEHANREMTRTIDIEQFVDVKDIDVRFFDRPYIVVPGKNGDKGYVLLREALSKTKMAGVATIVVRARQHLAALMVQDEALLLILLRFKQELRDIGDFDIPGGDLRKSKVSAKEVDLAAQLVEGMSAKWNPAKYHDEYRDELMKLIDKKIKSGKTEVIEEPEEDETEAEPKTLNFMDVLKRSVAAQTKSRGVKKRPAKKKAASRKRAVKRKRAS
jgi:DNA end-binding protein Ku